MFQARFRSARVVGLGLGLALSSGACGDDGNGNKKDPAKFIGTWIADTGTLSPSCGGTALPAQSLIGEQLVFAAGTDSDLLVTRGSCQVKYDISGDVATARPGQTCSATFNNPLNNTPIGAMFEIAKASFTLVSGGIRGNFEQSGSATLTVPIPGFSGCSYTINASATKKL
jgi:hypothetical protein